MATSTERVAFAGATPIEARALRKYLARELVVECGISLSRLPDGFSAQIVVSCGLAGGLRDELPTGTVVIPREVQTPNGEMRSCDREWSERLHAAAATLGYVPIDAPLLTSATIVTGDERRRWAERGFCAVDMETGLLRSPRIAAVRVILDTPLRELSPEWAQPARALLRPSNWPQAVMLAREAPRCADLAAQIAAAALALR